MISNTVITYGWKQYCYVSKTCTILDNPLIIESSRAPFFICIWGLKRLTNSCFSIQLTDWSRGDEVKGTKKISLAKFLAGFSVEPDDSAHFNERQSSSAAPPIVSERCSNACTHVHTQMRFNVNANGDGGCSCTLMMLSLSYWSISPSIKKLKKSYYLSEYLGPLPPWALFWGLCSKIDILKVKWVCLCNYAKNFWLWFSKAS